MPVILAILIFWGTFLSLNRAEAREIYVVTAGAATVFHTPSEGGRTGKILKRGRRIEAAGGEENGFLPVATRGGGKVWVKTSDVKPEGIEVDALDVAEPGAPARRGSQGSPLGLERLTFDLGASGGSSGAVSYTEVEFGLNAYFSEWLAWRNAVFGRFPSTGSSIYGLDSSVRGILGLSAAIGGVTIFAGPGVRFPNQGAVTPFAEAGLVFRLAGLALGGGAKAIFNSWVQSGVSNDTQYFIILAGGGNL